MSNPILKVYYIIIIKAVNMTKITVNTLDNNVDTIFAKKEK